MLKILDLASKATSDVKSKLIENALEDIVSAFDGFGREHCSDIYQKISFQNISSAKDRLLKEHGLDISSGLSSEHWNFVAEQFQKRHLVAHKMGVIDEEFIKNTGKPQSVLGRKVSITKDDVRLLIGHLKIITENLFKGVNRR